MKKSLQKLLLLIFGSTTLLLSNSQLDFSLLVNEFMNESNVLKTSINLSGKQRMLTQEMSKLALQINLNIQKKTSKERLRERVTLYDTTLTAFKMGNSDLNIVKSTNQKVLKQIVIVEKEWIAFKKQIEILINEKEISNVIAYVINHNVKLLAVSNKLVEYYEASNTSTNYLEKARFRIINVAGRQRMLTQKMTKEKLLTLKKYSKNRITLEKTIKLFDNSLLMLTQGDTNQDILKPTNDKIINQLKTVKHLWDELKPLYEKKKNRAKELAIIISKNQLLLKEMNTMVQLAENEVEY